MEKISIVPEMINSNEIILTDVNNMPILICKKSRFKFNYNLFQNPYIIVDNFEKDKYKEVEIIKIGLDTLDKLGFRFVSVKTKGNLKNYANQRKSYILERKNKPLINADIATQLPADHFLERDVIGDRIRIRGKNCYPYRRAENSTPWVEVKDD